MVENSPEGLLEKARARISQDSSPDSEGAKAIAMAQTLLDDAKDWRREEKPVLAGNGVDAPFKKSIQFSRGDRSYDVFVNDGKIEQVRSEHRLADETFKNVLERQDILGGRLGKSETFNAQGELIETQVNGHDDRGRLVSSRIEQLYSTGDKTINAVENEFADTTSLTPAQETVRNMTFMQGKPKYFRTTVSHKGEMVRDEIEDHLKNERTVTLRLPGGESRTEKAPLMRAA